MIKWIFILCLFPLALFAQNNGKQKQRPNILFIAIDDLRPELGCYGSPVAITPNMDKLAARGFVFEKAFCSQSLCSPARTSIMTGVRPETSGIVDNYTDFREVMPTVVALPQLFRTQGYETTYIGKVYEPQFSDLEFSWSRQPAKIPLKDPNPIGGYADPKNVKLFTGLRQEMKKKYGDDVYFGLGRGPAYESANVGDNGYKDGYNTEVALASMREMSKQDKPFFLAVGFQDPHLDFNAPKKYWDLYNAATIPLSAFDEPPVGAAAMGVTYNIELRDRYGIPKTGPINNDTALARTLKHGYLAATSYVDALVGKLLDQLTALGLAENTIVVLWGDQGYHLGEMGIWGKATNYDVATRFPLIIATPELRQKNTSTHVNGFVEQVDIYPTLCDMVGIPTPNNQLEGVSFLPLLSKPNKRWKKAVFSMSPTPAIREWGGKTLDADMKNEYFLPLFATLEQDIQNQVGSKWDRELFEKYLVGYTMRTKRYRLVLWKDSRTTSAEPIFTELYDYKNTSIEKVNIADQNQRLVRKLSKQFNKGWKGNLPKSLK